MDFSNIPIVFLDECSSTQDVAKELHSNKDVITAPFIVASGSQTKGRGRHGNLWESDPFSNILATIVIEPHIHVENSHALSDFAIFIVISFLKKMDIPVLLHVMPPNDIYANEKKISGILIENTLQENVITTSYIGIGINVNQEIFNESKAISLFNVTNKKYSLFDAYDKFQETVAESYRIFFQ